MNGYDSACCFRSSDGDGSARLLWELNTTCNLACRFCHTSHGRFDKGLEYEEIHSRLVNLQNTDIRDIIFSGGEPLLRPDILDILRCARGFGYSVDLCTNGTLVTPAMSGELAECLCEVSVSLDSADEQVHDSMRGVQGAQKRALRGIAVLQDSGLRIHAITVVNDATIASLPSTVAMLEQIGVESVTLLGEMSVGESEMRHKRESYAGIVSVLRRDAKIPVNTKRLTCMPSEISCPAGRMVWGIDARGQMLPCILFKGLGAEDGLFSWRNKFDDERSGRCSSCQHASGCRGGCPGASILSGQGIGIDPLCMMRNGGDDEH